MQYIQSFLDEAEEREVLIDFAGYKLSVLGKTSFCTSFEELKSLYIEQVGALLQKNPRWIEPAGAPARLLDLDSIRYYTEHPQKLPSHPALDRARQQLQEKLGWQDYIADQLDYIIAIRGHKAKAPLATGLSKQGGCPDLPDDFVWPGERIFVCQINLSEFKPFDIYDAFPSQGMIYYFVNESCNDNRVFYLESTQGLKARKPPLPLPEWYQYYESELIEEAWEFFPALSGLDEKEAAEVPNEIVQELSQNLKQKLVFDDPGAKIFGRPDGELEDEVFRNYKRPKNLLDPKEWVQYQSPWLLALQFSSGDGFLYLGLPPGDLKKGQFHNARAVYWGT